MIVKPGAKLIVDGGHLTTYPTNDSFWQGIEVWGTTDENQYPAGNPTYQGYCELKNDAAIENAIEGIVNWKPGDWSKRGGVIVAELAHFKNNIRSISFVPYSNFSPIMASVLNDDQSSFTDCSFEINDDYIVEPGKHFMMHVEMYDVRGIKFIRCSFANTQSNKTYAANENSNQAIHALDAGFTVTGTCNVSTYPGYPCPDGNLDFSTFEGFNIAIRLSGSSTTKTAKITQCRFDNNARAIQVEGIDNAVITRNEFGIGDCEITGIPGTNPSFYGIKLIECDGFMVEENKLIGVENYILPSIGIMPYHTNKGPELQENNQIYNNDFTDIVRGIHPVGVNTTAYYSTGLQLLCNNFYNSFRYDIDIRNRSNENDPNAGIRQLQGTMIGSNFISAGNRFTYDPPPSFVSNYNNQGDAPIDYYYYDDPNDPTLYPAIHNYPWVKPLTGINVLANNCPSHITMGIHYEPELELTVVGDVYSKFLVGKTAYWNLYYAYLQEIDGGNTPLVLQQIQNTWPQEAWDLRNDLMDMAPYVSRDALEEAAQSGVLPDAMLFEICLANPDATRDQEFLDLLANGIPNPLPNYMISLIQANWDLETPLTILKRNMASAASKMDYNLSILLTNEKLKPEPDNNLLRNFHSQRDNLGDRYSIVDSYIAEAKFDSSVIVLDQILVDFDLDDVTMYEYDNYYLYHDLLQSLNDNDRSIFDLDTTEIALLDQIANDHTGTSGIKSRNILCFAFGLCEEYPGNPSDTSQNKSTQILMPPQQIINEAYTTLMVTPNPATIFAEFSWEILNLENEALLEIVDMDGKVVATYSINEPQGKWAWNTRNTIPGVYIYSLRGSGSILKSGKITVLKK